MTDIWSFLLQTLTASGVAALLLAVKAMFRDKLSPRWQFAVWGVLAVILLLPAGRGGRYVLLNWPLVVETAKSALTGEFGTLTRVAAPVPLPPQSQPQSVGDWLFLVYLAGVVFLLARYAVSYVRLRLALNRGRPAQAGRVKAVAEQFDLPTCPSVEVAGLSTAFICGVFRPVLALPAGVETDDKVILHELLHLKYRDAAWGLVIAFFRCIHWCNPLIWLCADRAGNDLEALCDQRVLERLEGEDRRDYGRILLSMADETYARAPGTSSAANGGKNIARRIQAIARFKRYPAGMGLVSVCVALVLAFPLILGARADTPQTWSTNTMVMASARTTYCTTYAGAFDAYAKALLTGEISYRAMCAPLSEQNGLTEAWGENGYDMSWLWNQAGDVRSWPNTEEGYKIYNLSPTGDGAWEGLLVLTLNYTPDDEVEWAGWDSTVSTRWLAIQKLRAEKEGDRWVVIPQEKLHAVQGDERDGGNLGVPAWVYEGQYGDFTICVQWQTTASVNSRVQSSELFWSFSTFDTVPRPNAEFDQTYQNYLVCALYTGSSADRENYTRLEVEYTPVYDDADWGDSPKITSEKMRWCERDLKEYWGEEHRGDWIFLVGGGGGYEGPNAVTYQFPTAYAAKLYLNGEFAAELTLLPEGGEWLDG